MPGFNAGDIEGRLILDRSQFSKELKEAEREAERFEKKKRTAKVGLELDTTKANKDLDAFKRELAGVKDAKVHLTLDTKKSKDDLKKLYKDVERSGDVTFTPNLDAKKIRAEVAALSKTLRGTLNFDAEINSLNTAVSKLKTVRAGNVEASSISAATGTVDKLRGQADYDVKIDQGSARSQAASTAAALKQDVKFNVNIDQAATRSLFRSLATSLGAENKVKLKTEVDKASLVTVAQEIDYVTGKDGKLKREVKFDVKVDAAKALAEVKAVETAAESLSGGIGKVGSAAQESMSTFATYSAIAAAALPPIGAAISALPGLLLEMAIPIAAIAIGMDGIKAAAQELRVPFNNMKNEVSAAFEKGLKPAMQDIAKIMPALTQGFVGTAEALSFMAREVVQVATSGESIKNLGAIFQDVNKMVTDLTPSISGLIGNFIALGAEATAGLRPVPAQMFEVSREWEHTIQVLTNTGSARTAITGLFDVITQLLGVIAPLTQLGTTLMAQLGTPLAAAVGILGAGLQVLADIFSALPGPIQGVVAALAAFRIASAFLGRGARADAAQVALMTTAMRNAGVAAPAAAGATTILGRSAATAATQAGTMSRAMSGLSSIVGGAAGGAFLLGFAALTLVGSAISDVQQKALASQQSINAFTEAFAASGGAIDNTVVNLVKTRAAALGVDTELNKLGITNTQLVTALAGSDRELASLQGKMLAGTNIADKYGFAFRAVGDNLQATGGLAGAAGFAIGAVGNILSGIFGDGSSAAAANLGVLNREFDLGVQQSTRLGQAQSDLMAVIAATGQATDNSALQTAAWAATYEALTDGTKTAAEVTQVAASAFGLASESARNMATGLATSTSASQDLKKAFDETDSSLVNMNGTIDLSRDGGLQLQSAMLQAAQGTDILYASTLEATGSTGQAAGAAALYRQSLIEMGDAAGVPRERMQALVDTLIAIPSEVKSQVSLPGGVEAVAIGMGINDAIVAIPDSKSIIVSTLDGEARAALESLGLQVTDLPDGNIEIRATDLATPVHDGITTKISLSTAYMGISAEDRGAQQAGNESKSFIDTLLGIIGIGAEERGFTASGNEAKSWIDSLLGIMGINAEDRGARSFGESVRAGISGLLAKLGVSAEDRGALAQGNTIANNIGRILAKVGVSAVDRGAIAAAQGIVATISRMVATIGITTSSKNVGGPAPKAMGDIVPAMMADGGMLKAYASGGFASRVSDNLSNLRSMAANFAQIVKPNSWRIIGDRSRDDEAYIPINRSGRSIDILSATARLMGFELLDLKKIKEGNEGQAPPSAPTPAGLPVTKAGTRPDEAIKNVVAAFNQSINRQQTEGNQAIIAAQNHIAAKLEALLEMLERRGAAATINVQTDGGDPTAAARAMVLALRTN